MTYGMHKHSIISKVIGILKIKKGKVALISPATLPFLSYMELCFLLYISFLYKNKKLKRSDELIT